MLTLNLSLPKSRFLLRESLPLQLTLQNTGPTAVTIPDPSANVNWQPVYRLTGPGLPAEGRSFSFRSAAIGESTKPLPESVARLITIDAGQSQVFELPVNQLIELNLPGRYEISASLTWSSVEANAPRLPFELVAADPQVVAVTLAEGQQPTLPLRVPGVFATPGGARMGIMRFSERRPDLGRIIPIDLLDLGAAPAGTTGVLATLSNTAGLGTPPPVVGAVLPDQIVILSEAGKPPVNLPLPAGSKPASPLLLDAAGDLNLFTLAPAGELQFIGPGATDPSSPARFTFPTAPTGARATVASAKQNSLRVFAALVPASGGTTLHLLKFTDLRSAPTHAKLELEGLAGTAAVAVHVDESGVAFASALLRRNLDRPELDLIDARWDASGLNLISKPATIHVGEAPSALAIAYSYTSGQPRRRVWAVLSANRTSVLTSAFPSGRQLPNPAVLPLQLMPMSVVDYVLTQSPVEGLIFHPVQ